MFIGTVLRMGEMHQGLWRDEASTYFDAIGPTIASVWERVTLCELNPPGYFLAMHLLLTHVPVSDFTMKLPSLVCSVLVIPAAAWLAWIVGGWELASAAAALTACAPMGLYYAQEARPYMPEALPAVLATALFFAFIRSRNGVIVPALFVVSGSILISFQYTGIFLLVALFLTWIGLRCYRYDLPRAPIWVVSAFTLIALTFLPWIPHVLTQMHAGLAWEPKTSPLKLPVVAVQNFFVTLPLDWVPHHQLVKGVAVAAIIVEALLALRLRRTTPPDRRATLTLALTAIVIVISILEVPISNHGRYMVAYAPLAWVAFASWLIFGFGGRTGALRLPSRLAMAALLCALVLCDIVVLRHISGDVKSGAQALSRMPLDTSHTQYLVAPDLLGPTVAYYLRDRAIALHGLARWDHAELFEPVDFKTRWNDPRLVDDELARIAQLRSNGITRLVVFSSYDGIHFGPDTDPVNRFISRLTKVYPLLSSTLIPGHIESFSMLTLNLQKPYHR